jgi:ABC-type lipoprotein release transport system permease subunit
MTAAWLWARSRFRHRWRSLLVIAVVAGVGAGVALTAAAGSRRAATGLDRFRATTAAFDAIVSPPPDADLALLEQVAQLPGVRALGSFTYTAVAPTSTDPADDVGAFVALDDGFGSSVYRPRILEGRRPDLRRDDEVSVNRAMASLAGIRAGDRIRLRSGFTPGPYTTLGPVTVTGIHVGQFDVGANGGQPNMLLGAGFFRAHEDDLVLGGQPAVVIRLASGEAGVADLNRRLQPIYGGTAVVSSASQDDEAVRDTVNVQRIGLLLLAVAAGLATLVAAVQAIGRVFGTERSDITILRSLGLRRRQLALAGGAVSLAAGVAAAAFAVAVAVSASRLVPSGSAGRLEPPGLRLEPAVLAAGIVAIVLALTAAGALMVLRVATHAPRPSRAQPAVIAGPLPLRLGVQWAFSRATPGAATSAARAALVAVVVGMAGITAVVTFAASLDRLVDTPRLYGWDFDGGFKSDMARPELQEALAGLADDRRVRDLAWGSIVDVAVGGSVLEVYAFDQARGVLHPSLIDGRAPAGSDEIALGSEVLSRLGLRIGSRVAVGEGGSSFRVVGRAVYPELGNSHDLANAGSITDGGLARLDAEPVLSFALFRATPGGADALVSEYRSEGIDGGTPLFPSRVKNLREVGSLPWLMAGFLAMLALTAVGHALVLSVRARRQELAVLRAIGAVRGQVASAVWSQATITVLAGSVVGLPLGVAIGRQTWALIADGLGVVDSSVFAWLILGAVVVGVVGVVNVVATGPAMIAARLRPAVALRSE